MFATMSLEDAARVTLGWKDDDSVPRMPLAKLLPLARQAAASAPDRVDLKVRLAAALFDAGHAAELIALLGPQLADEHAAPDLLYWLGRAAVATLDDQLALAALRAAAAKGSAKALDVLASTLARLGRGDEAIEAGMQALTQASDDSGTLRLLAGALLDRGEAERLWTLCVDLRSRGAKGGWLPAVMATTAATLGRADDYAKLMDRSRWFHAAPLAVPDGFNRVLAAEILAHASAGPFRPTATQGAGARIDDLQRKAGPNARKLHEFLRDAVETYVADRRSFADDPMIAARPAAVTIESWSLATHDDGHTEWHIHPDGWISGVYYVHMPDLDPGDAHRPGEIELGPFPFGRDTEALAAHRWHLMPEPGLLLLFPSYYGHRSWPTGVAAPRISIAFDVRPPRAAREPAHHD
jgi:uncharacterized protein (TIGR02466 family)